MINMTPSRPYLVRALYEWIVDNNLTPYILVDAGVDNVQVPEQHIQDGKIVLNITPTAVNNMNIGNEDITFSARFSGAAMSLYIPINAVLAIYAMENGQGMVFSEDDGDDVPPEPSPEKPGKPSLKVVK
jgi:stringent starvation protein B